MQQSYVALSQPQAEKQKSADTIDVVRERYITQYIYGENVGDFEEKLVKPVTSSHYELVALRKKSSLTHRLSLGATQ